MVSNIKDRPSLKERVCGKWAGSLTSWVLYTPIAFTVSLSFEGQRVFKDSYQIFIVALFAHVFMGLIFIVSNFTLLRNKSKKPTTFFNVFLTFLIAGFARIISADQLSDYLTGDNLPLSNRFINIPVMIITFFILTFVLDFIDRQLSAIARLSNELQRLELIRVEALRRLNEYQSDLLSTITNQISPGINQLEKMYLELIKSKDLTVRELNLFIQTVKEWNQIVIRSISRLKFEGGKNLLNLGSFHEKPSKSLISLINIESLSKSWSYYPGFVWLPFVLISCSLVIANFGLMLAFEILLVHLFLNLIFLLAQYKLIPKLQKRSVQIRLIFLSFPYFLYGIAVEGFFLLIIPGISSSSLGIWVYFLPLWSLVVMVFSGVIRGITGEGWRTQERLLREIISTRNSAGEILESIKKIQKIFLDTIHGRIQSRFTAAILLFESTIQQNKNGVISHEAIDKLTNQLDQFVTEAQSDLLKLTKWQDSVPDDVDHILETVKRDWNELVKIDLDIDLESKNILNKNQWLRSAFEDAVNESVVNAVRHGSAKNVEISSSFDSAKEILNLSIFNDGKLAKSNQNDSGIGFQVLKDLGIGIEEISTDSGYKVKFSVPLYLETSKELNLI